MEMGRWAIWRSIWAEAWGKTASDLRLTGGAQLMTPVLLFAIYAVLVWFVVGEQHAFDEVRDRLLLIGAPLLIFPLWWFARVLLTIPEREQRTAKRIDLLHTYMRPRLSVELIDGGAPTEFPLGDATKTAGGDIVTNISGYERIICVAIKNASAKDATMIAARFSELVGNNGNRMRDPVTLHWAPIGSRDESAIIPARGERTLQLFRVTNNGVYFANPNLPLEYQQFFAGGTRFTGRIVIEEIYHCSLEVHFALELDGEPKLQIVHSNAVTHRTPEEHEKQLVMMEPHHV